MRANKAQPASYYYFFHLFINFFWLFLFYRHKGTKKEMISNKVAYFLCYFLPIFITISSKVSLGTIALLRTRVR